MKIRVSKVKEDKGEFRGLLLSFCCFSGGSSVWGRFPRLLNRTGQRSQETLRKKPLQGAAYSVMPLKAGIRPVWNIWRKITGSRSTMINTMFL